MDTIVKIAQTFQQERANEKQQWNNLRKNQKSKNKMLQQQLDQIQAMNLSLERENERLWRMISHEKPVQVKKRKFSELVDLTEDDESVITVKKEIKPEIIELKNEIENDIGELIENLHDMSVAQEKQNIQIEMTELAAITENQDDDEPEEEEGSEPDQEEKEGSEPDQEKEEGSEPDQEKEEDDPDHEHDEETKVDEEEEEVEEEKEVSEEEKEEEVEKEVEEEKEVSEEEKEEVEEEEVFLVTIDGKSYFTTNEKNGMLYGVTSDGDVGEEVGYYENGEAGFYEE